MSMVVRYKEMEGARTQGCVVEGEERAKARVNCKNNSPRHYSGTPALNIPK